MSYTEEMVKFIQKLKDCGDVPDYFIQVFQEGQRPDPANRKKNVGIIGDEFLSLYVRAYGLTPIFLNGGSYYTGENASHIFPQISDPVAKASLGFLLDESLGLHQNIGTVLISATNDSYKKSICYLRELGITIIEVEPPSYVLEKMPLTYVKEQVGMLNCLSKIANTRLSGRRLRAEIAQGQRAYRLIQSERFKHLPALASDFIRQTLVLADCKERWCDEVERYLEGVTSCPQIAPILVIGSPLKFPCSKIHEIFADVGMDHFQNACIEFPDYRRIPLKKSTLAVLWACFNAQYHHGFHAQTLADTRAYKFPQSVQGVIYHLLKGQVSSAYEAEQMEKAAIHQDVPFLCVETDYTYADKEQIKIRIEAFCEMLRNSANQPRGMTT